MRLRLCAALAGIGCALLAVGESPRPVPAGGGRGEEFDPPEMILDGAAIDGSLHPHYADFDGDGATDQLVGVGDRLLVYRNRGTTARPDYAPPTWFDEAEPSARIPEG